MSVRNLRVEIDTTLIFQNRIITIEHKLSKGHWSFCKLKFVLPPSTLLKLYYPLIYPFFLYRFIV